MKFNKLAFVIAFVFTAVLFAEVALHAAVADQSTKITFSQPADPRVQGNTQAGNDWTWHSLAGATSMACELGECQAK
jgi:hypothetical protein